MERTRGPGGQKSTRDRPFAQRLAERVRALQTRLVVGLDPDLRRVPREVDRTDVEHTLVEFCCGVLDAVADQVAAIKPQVAFFERHGWRGWRALQQVLEHAGALGVPVILDAKRGDIGSTARAYADGLLGDEPGTPGPHVDALTVNPYLGSDALEPFLERARAGRRGLFLLARTSNPGSAEIQQREGDVESVSTTVARLAECWNASCDADGKYGLLGLVAGATHPAALRQIRAAAPRSILLLPGWGAQGGRAQDLLCAFDGAGLGALASSSRAIIFARPPHGPGQGRARPGEAWCEEVRRAATAAREELEACLQGARAGGGESLE